MSKARIVIISVASVVMVIAAIMLLKSTLEYKRAEAEYSNLAQYAKVGTGAASEESAQTEAAATDSSEEEDGNTLKRNYNRSDFPDMEIDFDSLEKINGSFVCWLYAPGAEVNHPVVQGQDNEFYLHHTFEMQKNSAGCVFMDSEVDPALTSWNTFFYGHNMKNGTMFGHLKNYINNKATYDEYPYIYVFRPEGIYRYEVFSFYLDTPDSKMYYNCQNFEEYRAYLHEADAKSLRECSAKSDRDKNIVTLVTCSGAGASKQRFFVHGVFKDVYLFEE